MRVIVKADIDSGDFLELELNLPALPRVGDALEFWDPTDHPSRSGPEHAKVELVAFPVYAPEQVEVWVRFETYDAETVRRVMGAAAEGVRP